MCILTIPYVRLLALVDTTGVEATIEVPMATIQGGRVTVAAVEAEVVTVVVAEVGAEVVVSVPFLPIPDILRILRTRTPRTIHIVVPTDMTG